MDYPYVLNLQELGIKTNKDIRSKILAYYKVHKAGKARGNGLFASLGIVKDQEIIRAIGPKISPEVSDILYMSYGIDVTIQVSMKKWVLPINETRFLNHSCNPNMGFRGSGVFIAMRDIQKGEELTFDYSMNEIDPGWTIDCFCKTKYCRKKVTGKDIFDKKLGLAKRYYGYLPPYVIKELKKRNF